MTPVRIATVCLASVGALLALSVGSASAFENLPAYGKCVAKTGGQFSNAVCTKLAKKPEGQKFEWEPLLTAVKFSGVKESGTGKAVLEAASGAELACPAASEKGGEFGPGNLVKNVVLEFSGCEWGGADCNTEGHFAGVIVTNKLHGEPGVVKREAKEEKNIDGSDLRAEAGGPIAEFTCGPAPAVLRGGVVAKAQADSTGGTSGEYTNKMVSKMEVEFVREPSGKQVPEAWTPDGQGVSNGEHVEIKENLEAEFAGGEFQANGLTLTLLQGTPGTAQKVELRQCESTITCST